MLSRPLVTEPRAPASLPPAIDPVGLSWIVTVRWTTLVAIGGAIVAGKGILDAGVTAAGTVPALAVAALSNLWLMWRVRAGRSPATISVAGALICADIILLTWVLWQAGGVLNPASVFYLVLIVVAALVLGRVWTWIVTALSVAGYAGLFLGQTGELRAAQVMHPEIALHMRGMWLAFALTAVIVAILLTRLVLAVERRDLALESLRERSERASRLAGLATLATGAAHELSTPLATMAVAAGELERSLAGHNQAAGLLDDARLIRAEIDRCRRLLESLAGQSGEPAGQAPQQTSLSAVLARITERLTRADAARVDVTVAADATVVWPVEIVATAVANLIRNGLQASPPDGGVVVDARHGADGQIQITATDRGSGMSPDQLARAGEPFFTTKPAGHGTGLGLFVARSSIEQLGGRLVLSSSPGAGTIAQVTLPADVVAARTNHV